VCLEHARHASMLNITRMQIPGPGAHKIVDLDVYKLRPPKYSMTAKHPPIGDRTQKPGPASYYPDLVTCTLLLCSFCFLGKGARRGRSYL